MREGWPRIEMCWDGETPQAELIVDGISLPGPPTKVREIFDRLSEAQRILWDAQERLDDLKRAVEQAVKGGGHA